ncbi:MAG: hypothetical protein ACLFQE_07245 [Thermotogota bacterium]
MTQTLLEKMKLAEEKVGKDWLNELGDCETKQQLKIKADEWGVVLSEQETEEAFGLLSNKKNGELSDEELAGYAGGLLVDLSGLDNPPPAKTEG